MPSVENKMENSNASLGNKIKTSNVIPRERIKMEDSNAWNLKIKTVFRGREIKWKMRTWAWEGDGNKV